MTPRSENNRSPMSPNPFSSYWNLSPLLIKLGTLSKGKAVIHCEEPNYQDKLLQAKSLTFGDSGFLWLNIGFREVEKPRVLGEVIPIRLLLGIEAISKFGLHTK